MEDQEFHSMKTLASEEQKKTLFADSKTILFGIVREQILLGNESLAGNYGHRMIKKLKLGYAYTPNMGYYI